MLKKIVKKIIQFIVALLLFLVTFTLLIALFFLFNSSPATRQLHTFIPFAAGFGAGVLCFSLFLRFNRLYVFGHELTHFLIAKLFSRRTGRFRIGSSGGSVAIERPNIWITLAPYFIPIYALIWTGIYGLCQFFIGSLPAWTTTAFPIGLGVTYSHHIILTLRALRTEQSDLRRHGRLLSLSVILFCNILLLFSGTATATSAWEETGTAIYQAVRKEIELTAKFVNFV